MREIKDDIKYVKKLLIGNGKVGVAEMSRRSFEWMSRVKSSKNGLLDWTFRGIIGLVLSFIAMKVGMK
jgi:hypothetical protein